MKTKIILISTIIVFNSFCYGQDGIITCRITLDEKCDIEKDSDFKVKNLRDDIMQKLLKDKKLISFRQSFPHSKYPELLKLYSISFYAEDSTHVMNSFEKAKYVKKFRKLEKPHSMYEPSDYMYTLGWLWHIDKIQADKAWDITTGSNDVTIAIIDTKFDFEHPDLKNKFIVNYDPYSGIQHVQLPSTSNSTDAHGTAVASTAIAETNGGGQLASVGFNTRFYAYTWDGDDVAKAYHASFTLGVDVISCSFYSSCSYYWEDAQAISEIIDNGTIMVAAAGNGAHQCSGGETCPYCSLNDDRIIIVSSTGHNDEHTLFEPDGTNTTDSHYPGVDICAPGIDIPVATPSGGTTYPYFGGSGMTSISTPMVASTCALMRSVNKCISPEVVEYVLCETADPITDEHLYSGLLGGGRLNTYQAVLGAIVEGTEYFSGDLYEPQTINGLYLESRNTTIIKNGANIVLKAEEDITFAPGFEVELGGVVETQQSTYSCQ
ncbi:MAG: S8/S53 family peptidase [Bacteroidales bacterium]|nr:S8/S53 family peptidase [Bacteroidales bacterium]MBN2817795.1 S8/S53 family peptidase [Bacteroidales bacterium]